MKTVSHFLFTSAIILFFCGNIFAQSHEMYLPIPTEATYINEIINGDTLANGSRADLQRVYVLQRGGVWFFNGIINSVEWDVNIKAENGSGPKPVIYAAVASGEAAVPSQFIVAEGNVNLKNIVVNGIFDLDTAYTNGTYGAIGNVIRYNTAGDYSLVIDSCIFSNAYSSEIGIFGAIRSIRATNTLFTNYGVYPRGDVGNGRALDLRNVSLDTLYLVNNTFVNGFDRVFRHIASTGRLQNIFFEHNTILNDAGTYGVIALGLVGAKVNIGDNLFVDPMCSASDTVAQRQYDFKENGETFSPDLPGKVKQAWIYSQKVDSGYVTDYKISKNYWYTTPAIQAAWADMKSQYRPLLKPAPMMTDYLYSKVSDSASAFIELNDISFTNAPGTMEDYVRWFFTPAPEGSNELNSGGNFKDQDRRTGIYYRDTMDCSYSTSSPAYTGGSDGFPAGDLNWFPNKKAEWLQLTDVKNVGGVIPMKFSLEQNFPNPFNPSTMIKFSIPKANRVTLVVYNLLGQKIATLIDKDMTAGDHQADFNAANLSSGIYFYSLTSGTYNVTKKMILLK